MAMDVSPVKEDGNAFKVLEEKLMTCASNTTGNTLEMEDQLTKHTKVPSLNEDLEINIITVCRNSGEEGVVEIAFQEATESSSSFGDTDAGMVGTPPSDDIEVESRCQEEGTSMLFFHGLYDLFQIRKKKVSTHWKKFIHPLMWRCKWVELQIKELQCQASKYDEELAKCDERKRLEQQGLAAEDHSVKRVSTTLCHTQSVNVMRRKRRRRVEEKIGIESYMSAHNLFSYYVTRRSIADDGYIDKDRPAVGSVAANKTVRNDEFCANEDWVSREFKHGDSFEEMLQKIGDVQEQLQLLRAWMNKLISENTVNFLSDNLSLLAPCHAQASSAARSQLPLMNGDANSRACSALLFPESEHKATEQVLRESAVSSYGEAAPLPDMIEGIDQPLTGFSCERVHSLIEDPTRLFNQSVKEELHMVEDYGLRLVSGEKPQSSNDKETATPDPLMNVKQEPPSDTVVATKLSTLKSRSISKSGTPKSKRKRGRRKAASSKWTCTSSGVV